MTPVELRDLLSPVGPLRLLRGDATLAEIEQALREFAAALEGRDALARAIAEEGALRELERLKVRRPAALLQAALGGKSSDTGVAGQAVTMGDVDPWPEPVNGVAPELLQALREHKPALMALLQGTEVEAGPEWRPRLGESWPATWADGRCVRCDGRRWVGAEAEGRWLCAGCGVKDPDRPVPARIPEGPEPAVSQDDLTGWPAESIEALRLYHQPPVLNAPHARLYPLVGRRVRTPHGVGSLLAVYALGCPVVLDRPDEAVVVPWQEVKPA